MLPKSTDNLPYITVYLMDQLIGSTLTVVVSIGIVQRTLRQETQANVSKTDTGEGIQEDELTECRLYTYIDTF